MSETLQTIATLLGVLVYFEIRAALARAGVAPRRADDPPSSSTPDDPHKHQGTLL